MAESVTNEAETFNTDLVIIHGEVAIALVGYPCK